MPLTIDEALEKLRTLIPSPASQPPPPSLNGASAATNGAVAGTEMVTVANAMNRIVSQDVQSPIAVPAFANSAMDGYALRHADLEDSQTQLRVQGECLAGHPFTNPLGAKCAVRIFTGAALPPDADTIVIQENTERLSAETVLIKGRPAAGAYVRSVGHDLPQGASLLAKGTRLRAFELAAATTSGLTHVPVERRLRVGVFATGDELKEPGESLALGQIYESNRMAIISLLRGLPLEITNLGVLPDTLEATRNALARAALTQDALITSGGVSVGDADYVREAIDALGAIDFWRLNLRPGKPFAFGHLNRTANSSPKPSNDRCFIFGLPGNPVSTIVTLLLLVKPALWHMAGATTEELALLRCPPLSAPLAQPISHSVGRHEYQRGRLDMVNGETRVFTTSDQSSNRLQSFSGANCLFLMPGEIAELAEGDRVNVLPFTGLV